MKRSKYSEEQIIYVLRQAESGTPIGDLCRQALTYTRTLVADLSPPVLRDHGLPAGLKWLGEYMKKYQIIVTVTVPEKD
jgi:signal transduction histidine kinase